MRIRLDSVGCRLNTSEIEAMARQLAAAGHRVVGPGDDADLCIFNTCTVTAIASRKSRRFIRQLRKRYPSAAIVVTGCHAELSPDEVRDLGVDKVVSNKNKEMIPQILQREGMLDNGDSVSTGLRPGGEVRTRAFLKVQDGCDNHCAFCVVTVARGEGRSLAPEEVLRQVVELQRAGHQEVVLSGVHLGSYGHDLGDRNGLANLVTRVFDETDLPRLRLSSLEPWDIDEHFFSIFDNPRLMPHLHLPLQSGCDHTLRRMARRCTTTDYARLVNAARDRITNLALSTDVMVAFPGETDEHFHSSLRFVEEMAFSRLHIFRFSAREQTPAARLGDRVPGPVSQERSRQMHGLGARLEISFREQQLGRTEAVLWEECEATPAAPRWIGLTPNYQRVVTEADDVENLGNRILQTRLVGAIPGALVGEIVTSGTQLRMPVITDTGSR